MDKKTWNFGFEVGTLQTQIQEFLKPYNRVRP